MDYLRGQRVCWPPSKFFTGEGVGLVCLVCLVCLIGSKVKEKCMCYNISEVSGHTTSHRCRFDVISISCACRVVIHVAIVQMIESE